MIDYSGLTTALSLVLASRRDAQTDLDTASIALLGTDGTSEEEVQTLGALVRQLDNAARELKDALKTGGRARVEARARLSAA